MWETRDVLQTAAENLKPYCINIWELPVEWWRCMICPIKWHKIKYLVINTGSLLPLEKQIKLRTNLVRKVKIHHV